MATITSLGFSIFSRFDGSGFRSARRELRQTLLETGLVTRSMLRLTRTTAMFGPVAIPIFAVASRHASQMATSFGAAASAMALLGVAAKSQLGDTLEAFKRLQQIEKSLKEVAKGSEPWEKLMEKRKNLLASLDKQELQALQNMQKLEDAYKNFGKSIRPQIFDMFAQSIRIAIVLLQKFERVLPGAAAQMKKMLNEVEAFVNSKAFDSFITWLAREGPKSMAVWWQASKNVGQALFIIGKRLGFFETSNFNAWLIEISERFLAWSKSPAIDKINKYLNDNENHVIRLYKAIFRLVKALIEALAPIGSLILKGLVPFVEWLAKVVDEHPGLIMALWGTIVALRAVRVGWVLLRIAMAPLMPLFRAFGAAFAWLRAPLIFNGIQMSRFTFLILVFRNTIANAIRWVVQFGRYLVWLALQNRVILAVVTWLVRAFLIFKNMFVTMGAAVQRFVHLLVFVALRFTFIGKVVAWLVKGFFILKLAFAAVAGAISLPVLAIAALVAAIGAALVWAYFKVGWFRKGVDAAWNGIATASKWLWEKVIKPVFNFIAKAVIWLYSNVIKPYAYFISYQWKVAWTVISSIFGIWIHWMKNVVFPVIRWFAVQVVAKYWGYIKFQISAMWTAIKIIFNALKWYYTNVLAPIVRWFFDKVIKPIWDAIAKKIQGTWNIFIRPVFNLLRDGISKVAEGFRWGASKIALAWKAIADTARTPIKFLIDTVWNKGIVGMWNKAAGVIPGMKKMDEFKPPKGLARGGVVNGYQAQKKDDVLMPMRRGEGVLVPEVVRGLGRGFVNSLNAIGNSRGVQGVRRIASAALGPKLGPVRGGGEDQAPWERGLGFAFGGIWDGLKNFGKAAKNKFTGGLMKVYSGVMDPLKKYMGGKFGTGQTTSAIPYHVLSALDGIVRSFLTPRDPAMLGDGTKVVEAARRYLGQGDRGGSDNNNNKFNDMWGFPAGTPWCANFVSTAIKDAKAGKFYPGYPSAAVYGYYSKMKKVPFKDARPGDLRATGSSTHINIVEGWEGRKLSTIGGNEGPLVRRSMNYQYGNILRPKPGAPGGTAAKGGGNAVFTSYWDANTPTASGSKMDFRTIASSYLPLGSKIRVSAGGRSEWGEIKDLGPAKFVYDRHPGKAVFDLSEPMMQRMTGMRSNVVNGNWKLLSVGSGRTLYGKSLKGYAGGGQMAANELALVGENGPEVFRAGGAGGQVYKSGTSVSADHITVVFEDKVYVKSEREFENMVVTAISEAKRKKKL